MDLFRTGYTKTNRFTPIAIMNKKTSTFHLPNSSPPDSPKLTARQQRVLDCIVQIIDQNGYPPTLREIGQRLGIKSTNGVSDHIKALQRKGYLKKSDLRARALTPIFTEPTQTPENSITQPIPLVGKVAAGTPIPRVEWQENLLHIDRSLLGHSNNPDMFALKVVGDSMIEDGIFEGDLLFVRRQSHANNGEVVIAVVDDEVTVKRLYLEPQGHIRLQPANARLSPMIFSPNEWQQIEVVGIAVGLYRKL